MTIGGKNTPLRKKKKAPVLQQLMEKEITTLREELQEEVAKIDERIRMNTINGPSGSTMQGSTDDPFFADRANFIRKKEAGILFDKIEHKDRVEQAKSIIPSTGNPNSGYKYNDEVVYELYTRYQHILEELNTYKTNLFYMVDGTQGEEEVINWNHNLNDRIDKLE